MQQPELNADDEAREQAWYDERTRIWKSFADAADASAVGDHRLAIEHCQAHPLDADQLRKFTLALRNGDIIREAPYRYRPVRKKF